LTTIVDFFIFLVFRKVPVSFSFSFSFPFALSHFLSHSLVRCLRLSVRSRQIDDIEYVCLSCQSSKTDTNSRDLTRRVVMVNSSHVDDDDDDDNNNDD
jgi:hypothetical protein